MIIIKLGLYANNMVHNLSHLNRKLDHNMTKRLQKSHKILNLYYAIS